MAVAIGIAAASAITGLISLFHGMAEKRKARKMLEQNKYPVEPVPSEVLQNQANAQRMANVGLPQTQYNQAQQNIARNQNAILAASQDRRAGLMGIGNLQQRSNDANLNLDVADANARMNNQRTLYDVNNQVAQTKRSIFDQNVRNKYLQNYNYAMTLLGAGNQNFVSGLDNIGAAGTMYLTNKYGGGSSGGFGVDNNSGDIPRSWSKPSLGYVNH